MSNAGIQTAADGLSGALTFGGSEVAKWNGGGTFIAPVTDNDGSFDLSAGQNFTCTPTAGFTLTFTNMASNAGKSGTIILANTSGYTISKAATTLVDGNFLTTVSGAGTYRLSYYSDGTNVSVSTTGALS